MSLSQKSKNLIKEYAMAYAEDICIGSNPDYAEQGRTDGRPHEDFEYDPKTGEEVPPCDSEQIMAMSRSKDEKTRDRGIELRWELFHQRLREHVNDMCKNVDHHLGFNRKG